MATAPVVTLATGRSVEPPPSSPSPVGLWYGKKSSSSLSPTTDQLIYLYKRYDIQKMWLCCDTPQDGKEILQSINSDGEANIMVVLYIRTPEVMRMENEWIQLIDDYQTVISYVCLGNVCEMNNTDISMIRKAMDKIHAINAASPMKVSTLVDVNFIFGTYDPFKVPSEYRFLERFKKILNEVFTRLVGNSTPLFVKAFPNFAIHDNIDKRRISLNNYLLEESACCYMYDTQANLEYKYVFDAMVDSISVAKDHMDASNVDISVVSGWPTAESKEATIAHARTYNKNYARHVNEDTPGKTTRKDHFIFSMLDEDLLPPNVLYDWKHFGTFTLLKNETFPEAT